METLRAEVEKFMGGDISTEVPLCHCTTEVPLCHFAPPLNISPGETEIVDEEPYHGGLLF